MSIEQDPETSVATTALAGSTLHRAGRDGARRRLVQQALRRDDLTAELHAPQRSARPESSPKRRPAQDDDPNFGAAGGNRTRDIQLGKLTFYL